MKTHDVILVYAPGIFIFAATAFYGASELDNIAQAFHVLNRTVERVEDSGLQIHCKPFVTLHSVKKGNHDLIVKPLKKRTEFVCSIYKRN